MRWRAFVVRRLRGGREPGWPVLMIGATRLLFGATADR